VPTILPIEFIEFAETRSGVPPSFGLICHHLPSKTRAFPQSPAVAREWVSCGFRAFSGPTRELATEKNRTDYRAVETTSSSSKHHPGSLAYRIIGEYHKNLRLRSSEDLLFEEEEQLEIRAVCRISFRALQRGVTETFVSAASPPALEKAKDEAPLVSVVQRDQKPGPAP
jgi:hypothetical protein